jgi:hypothetical protein
MFLRTHQRLLEEQEERDRRYGLEYDADEEFEHELELADRIAEQASLPPGDASCLAAARYRLGRGPCPYEQPHDPEPHRFAAGDRVTHHGPDGPRAGWVLRTLEPDGLAEVDFGRHGTTVVAREELEPEPTG